jgi:hypothetical protein
VSLHTHGGASSSAQSTDARLFMSADDRRIRPWQTVTGLTGRSRTRFGLYNGTW